MIKHGIIEEISILKDGRVELEVNEHNVWEDGLEAMLNHSVQNWTE